MVTMAGPRKKADQAKKNGISMDHHNGYSLSIATMYNEPGEDWCKVGRIIPIISRRGIKSSISFFRAGNLNLSKNIHPNSSTCMVV
jgi:hypothetical protein